MENFHYFFFVLMKGGINTLHKYKQFQNPNRFKEEDSRRYPLLFIHLLTYPIGYKVDFNEKRWLSLQSIRSIMLDTLPDDVLVKISITVANLCGAGDFLALSHTSRRLYSLLLESHTTVQSVLHLGSQKLHRSLRLPNTQHKGLVVESIPQLQLYENLQELKLANETKILGIAGRSGSGVEIFDAVDLHWCLQALSERIPVVHLAQPCSPKTTTNDSANYYIRKTKHYLHHDFCFRWQTVYEVLWKHLYNRSTAKGASFEWMSICSFDANDEQILVRCWNATSDDSKLSLSANEPMGVVARKGAGWVEVFLRMNTHAPNYIDRFPNQEACFV